MKTKSNSQTRTPDSQTFCGQDGISAEPSFEYKDSRLQALMDLAHDGDEIATAVLELIWELA